jgi:hypothetical protein
MPPGIQKAAQRPCCNSLTVLAAPDRHGNYPPMCCRYASFLPAEAIARIFGTVNPLSNLAAVLERRIYSGCSRCPASRGVVADIN